MIVLLLFAFLAGLVTILAPCIWPLLPIILSSSTTGGHRKSLGITLGIMVSFAFFTLTISTLVMLFHFDPNILRIIAAITIAFLGLTMIIPSLLTKYELLITKLSSFIGGKSVATHHGFFGGFITGLSLGIIWSPCAGPILATIATLGATQAVNFQVILLTIAYIIGVGIPLFIFSYGGHVLFIKSRFISRYTGRIQQVFGVVMILTAIAIYTNYDKVIQAKLLDAFPSYTTFLAELESNEAVKEQLDVLKGKKSKTPTIKEMMPKTSLPNLGVAPEFVGITNWLNSKPLTMQELKGKVVLIDFWTYTCINCIRTLPYVTSWYEKYKDKGFVVIGVHTPEFEFEKKTENVLNAIKVYNIHYPVPQDNDYATWNAYSNQYWPAKYLIDANGNIRYVHFGEGKYDEIEMAIKKLLEEKGDTVDQSLVPLKEETPKTRISPETYLGSKRMEYLYPNGRVDSGTQVFTLSEDPSLHSFSLGGKWTITDEHAIASNNTALLVYHFYANKVFLVAAPNTPIPEGSWVKVFLDGKPIGTAQAGKDVKNGVMPLDGERLYNLVDLKGKNEEHILRLEFMVGTTIYAFTFG